MNQLNVRNRRMEKEVHLDQEWKIEHWALYFGTTKEHLYAAVEDVGNKLNELEAYFNQNAEAA